MNRYEIREKLISREWTIEEAMDEMSKQGYEIALVQVDEEGWMASTDLMPCLGVTGGDVSCEVSRTEEPLTFRDAILSIL